MTRVAPCIRLWSAYSTRTKDKPPTNDNSGAGTLETDQNATRSMGIRTSVWACMPYCRCSVSEKTGRTSTAGTPTLSDPPRTSTSETAGPSAGARVDDVGGDVGEGALDGCASGATTPPLGEPGSAAGPGAGTLSSVAPSWGL